MVPSRQEKKCVSTSTKCPKISFVPPSSESTLTRKHREWTVEGGGSDPNPREETQDHDRRLGIDYIVHRPS